MMSMFPIEISRIIYAINSIENIDNHKTMTIHDLDVIFKFYLIFISSTNSKYFAVVFTNFFAMTFP